jgi:hypothetical protein
MVINILYSENFTNSCISWIISFSVFPPGTSACVKTFPRRQLCHQRSPRFHEAKLNRASRLLVFRRKRFVRCCAPTNGAPWNRETSKLCFYTIWPGANVPHRYQLRFSDKSSRFMKLTFGKFHRKLKNYPTRTSPGCTLL